MQGNPEMDQTDFQCSPYSNINWVRKYLTKNVDQFATL